MWILSRGKGTMWNVEGLSVGYAGIDTDITLVVEAEQARADMALQLSHSQRLQSIGQLSGGVAHDFNNLLAVISGNAEPIEAGCEDSDACLRDIIDATERRAELTERLLAFSRKQKLNPESINLAKKAKDIEGLLQRTLGVGIEIRMQVAEDQWDCFADVMQ